MQNIAVQIKMVDKLNSKFDTPVEKSNKIQNTAHWDKIKNMKYIFILFDRDRESKSEQGWGKEGERKTLKQAPRLAQSRMQGSIPQLWDHDLSQNQVRVSTKPSRCCIINPILKVRKHAQRD